MPDQIVAGPWIELLTQMGPQGIGDRYRVAGEHLHAVCLYHGVTEARILMTTVVPALRGRAIGRPQVRYCIQVWCFPWCGYRLAWLT